MFNNGELNDLDLCALVLWEKKMVHFVIKEFFVFIKDSTPT